MELSYRRAFGGPSWLIKSPTTPDLTQPHWPTQGDPWAVLPMRPAPLGAGEGRVGRVPLLDPYRI